MILCLSMAYVANYQIVNSKLENSSQLISDTNGSFILLDNNFFAGESGSWLMFSNGNGILSSLPVYNVKIAGNQFYPAGSNFTEFINFAGTAALPSSDIIVANNLFTSIGYSPTNVITMNYFQQVGIHDNIFDLVVSNLILNLSNDQVSSTGLWSHYHDNLRYNPIGQISPPAVPASGGAVYNHTGYDAFVVCTGGTNVTIDYAGVIVPSTGFPFPVAGAIGIIVSYTTAPTWQWYQI